MLPATWYRYKVVKAYDKLTESMLNSTDEYAVASDLEYFDRIEMANHLYRQYVSFDYVEWTLRGSHFVDFYTRYLQIEHPECKVHVVLPKTIQEMIKLCNDEHMISENVYYDKELQYLICRVQEEIPPTQVEVKIYSKANKWSSKALDKLMKRDIKETHWTYSKNTWIEVAYSQRFFCVDGYRYLIYEVPVTRMFYSATIQTN